MLDSVKRALREMLTLVRDAGHWHAMLENWYAMLERASAVKARPKGRTRSQDAHG